MDIEHGTFIVQIDFFLVNLYYRDINNKQSYYVYKKTG